jgi:hypothetical protein
MKLSNRKIEEVIQIIESFPALNRAAKATFALAKNLDKLEKEYEPFKEFKEGVWRKHFGLIDTIPDGDTRIPKYLEEINPVYETLIEFTPHKFNWEDLNINENFLSPKTLKELCFMIKDEEEDKKVENIIPIK